MLCRSFFSFSLLSFAVVRLSLNLANFQLLVSFLVSCLLLGTLGYCHRHCTNQVIRGEVCISPRVGSESCPFGEANLVVSPSTPIVEMRDAAVKLPRKAAKALLFPGNATCAHSMCQKNHDVKLMGQRNSILRLAAEGYFNSRAQSAGSA